MVGSPHHFPGVTVIVDMAAPGQRLKTHAQAMLCRAFAKFAEIGGAAIDAAKGFRRHIAAHQQQVAGQFLHEIELAFGTIEGALTLRVGHAFEIAKRLERDRSQAEIRHFLRNIGRGAVVGKQIAFENLNTAKARRRNRLQLFAQTAAETNRGNRCFHDLVLRFGGINPLWRLPLRARHNQRRMHDAGERYRE